MRLPRLHGLISCCTCCWTERPEGGHEPETAPEAGDNPRAVARSWSAGHEEKNLTEEEERDEVVITGLVEILGIPRPQTVALTREGTLVLRLEAPDPVCSNKAVEPEKYHSEPEQFPGFQEVGSLDSGFGL